MSEQRIDSGAEAATSTDADPGEGQGLSGGSAGSGDLPQPTADRPGGGTADTADSAETEGASHLLDTQARAGGTPDLSGRLSSGTDAGPTGSGGTDAGPTGSGGSADRSAVGRTGEIGSEPREHRREVDPGSVATEFGDRADEAPDDPIARPNI